MGTYFLKASPVSSSSAFILRRPPLPRITAKPLQKNHLLETHFPCSSSTKVLRRISCSNALGWFIIHRRTNRKSVTVIAKAAPGGSARKSEEEWRVILSPQQFHILRQKGTEDPSTGEYDKFFETGFYKCAGCGTPLYWSTTKFNSGCGWPSFYKGIDGAITRRPDRDGRRTEITCTACGGHLGHVFKGEGFRTPTDERHCVNSISLKFVPPKTDIFK